MGIDETCLVWIEKLSCFGGLWMNPWGLGFRAQGLGVRSFGITTNESSSSSRSLAKASFAVIVNDASTPVSGLKR